MTLQPFCLPWPWLEQPWTRIIPCATCEGWRHLLLLLLVGGGLPFERLDAGAGVGSHFAPSALHVLMFLFGCCCAADQDDKGFEPVSIAKVTNVNVADLVHGEGPRDEEDGAEVFIPWVRI